RPGEKTAAAQSRRISALRSPVVNAAALCAPAPRKFLAASWARLYAAWATAVPAHAEPLERQRGGQPGPRQHVQRDRDLGDEPRDVALLDQTGNEHGIGAGRTVATGALDGLGDCLRRRDEASQVDVGAGVDPEIDARTCRCRLDALDLLAQQ